MMKHINDAGLVYADARLENFFNTEEGYKPLLRRGRYHTKLILTPWVPRGLRRRYLPLGSGTGCPIWPGSATESDVELPPPSPRTLRRWTCSGWWWAVNTRVRVWRVYELACIWIYYYLFSILCFFIDNLAQK